LLGDQDVIAARFEFYDKDSSGTLDNSQVALVLKDLNGGKAVTAAEVQWVIDTADGKGSNPKNGVLNHEELKVAVAVWYTAVQEKKKSSACSIL
jgi:Ca2+-binding EF-hand superfamily protein